MPADLMTAGTAGTGPHTTWQDAALNPEPLTLDLQAAVYKKLQQVPVLKGEMPHLFQEGLEAYL